MSKSSKMLARRQEKFRQQLAERGITKVDPYTDKEEEDDQRQR